jgi:hypothetical protein
MRVAPVGAYFADDLAQAAEQAHRSARVTHAHPEASAGAIAVAIAAAWAYRLRVRPRVPRALPSSISSCPGCPMARCAWGYSAPATFHLMCPYGWQRLCWGTDLLLASRLESIVELNDSLGYVSIE